MLRRMIAVVILSLTASTIVVVGTTVQAVALNRCGDEYDWRSGPISLFYDPDPAIQQFRWRAKGPASHDVCVEFLEPNPNFLTQGHIIRFYDHGGVPAAKICGAQVCRWHSGDDHILVEVSFWYKREGTDNDWKQLEGASVLETQ